MYLSNEKKARILNTNELISDYDFYLQLHSGDPRMDFDVAMGQDC